MRLRIFRTTSLCFLAASLGVPGVALAEPTLAELYEMIQAQQTRIDALESEQTVLRQEAADARADAEQARSAAASAAADTTRARQQAERAEAEVAAVRADVSALPDVAAEGDEPAASPGGFVSFDAIYWAFDGGKETDYAGVKNPGTNSFDLVGEVETIDIDESWDFRGEAGWRFGNGIDVLLRGVSFDTAGGDEVTSADPFGIVPLANLGESDDISQGFFASGRISLDMFQLDLESGKWFSIGNGVALRPFAAIRYVDFDYESSFLYQSPFSADRLNGSTDWWGVGVLGGLEGEWSPIDRVRLFGRGGAGILGGEYKAKNTLFDVDGGYTEAQAVEEGDTYVPVLEASVGLGIDLWESDWFDVNVEAGYEALSFFDSPTVPQGGADDDRNPVGFDEDTVTLHGAFLRLGFGF